jgi:hypothetical protein
LEEDRNTNKISKEIVESFEELSELEKHCMQSVNSHR